MSPGAVWVMSAGRKPTSPAEDEEAEEERRFTDSDEAREAARSYLRDRCGEEVEIEEVVEGGSLFVRAREEPYSVRIERRLTTGT